MTTVTLETVPTLTTLQMIQARLEKMEYRGRGCHYPASLQNLVAKYCHERVVQLGYSWRSVEKELNIRPHTLQKWTREEFQVSKRGMGKYQSKEVEDSSLKSDLQDALDSVQTDLVTPQGFTIRNISLRVALLLINAEQPWNIQAEVKVINPTKLLGTDRVSL